MLRPSVRDAYGRRFRPTLASLSGQALWSAEALLPLLRCQPIHRQSQREPRSRLHYCNTSFFEWLDTAYWASAPEPHAALQVLKTRIRTDEIHRWLGSDDSHITGPLGVGRFETFERRFFVTEIRVDPCGDK